MLSAYRAGPRTPYGTDTTGCRWDPAGLTEIPRREIEIPRRKISCIPWQAMVKEAAEYKATAEDVADAHEAIRGRCTPHPPQ